MYVKCILLSLSKKGSYKTRYVVKSHFKENSPNKVPL